MQRPSDRPRKWRKRSATNFRGINSLRNTPRPRTRQLRQLTTELTTPTHLAPLSAYRATKPPHLAVEQSASIKPSHRSRHLLACFTRLLFANTILDPPRESFQLSGREPARSGASGTRGCTLRSLARAPGSCSVYLPPKDMTRLCAKAGPKKYPRAFLFSPVFSPPPPRVAQYIFPLRRSPCASSLMRSGDTRVTVFQEE